MGIGTLLLALGLAAVVVGVIGLTLLRRDQNRVEVEAGLEALRTLRWKEFAELVVASFATRGYTPVTTPRRPGEDGADHVLERGGKRHLLQIKHGGAYTVGAPVVRRLAGLLTPLGAAGGILATSGRFEPAAVEAARGQPLVLIDGPVLWQQIQPQVPVAILGEARERSRKTLSARASRWRSLLLVGVGLMLGGGGVLALGLADRQAGDGADRAAVASTSPAAADAAPAATPSAPATPSPRLAPEEPSEAELAVQRELVAAEVVLIEGIVSANWPSASTLQIALRGGTGAERYGSIVESVCAALLARDALRFTRLQIQDFDAGTDSPVRFQQCRGAPAAAGPAATPEG